MRNGGFESRFSRLAEHASPATARARRQAIQLHLPDLVLKRLHRIDQRCSGEVAMEEVVTSERQAGQRFLVNSLMEEAIRSSQLEGATTSRRVAKEMLRSGREPKNRSERMIANNYRALQFMREGMGEQLSPEAVLELHRIVTEGTLDDPEAAGRLQRLEETRVAVYDRDDGRPFIALPPRSSCRSACDCSVSSPTKAKTEPRSCIPWCAPSSCTSGSDTTIRSRMATAAPHGFCSSGRCEPVATGWRSTCRSRASYVMHRHSTPGPSWRPRQMKGIRPTS